MDCCGYDRVTPFCPMCGKKIATVPIMALLRHVRRTAQDRRRMEENSHFSIKGKDNTEYTSQLKRIAGKWEGWYKALNELIKKNAQE